ncbi:MAG: DUF4097 family beta strand repeat-containing protein [Gemmatimonadales bacterium]
MKRSSTLAILMALTLLAGGTVSAQDFSWSGRIAAGKSIEIKGINGNIRAVHTDGAEVQVTAEKDGRDRDELTFEVVEHSGGVTICAMYPGRSNKPNECAPGDDGRMNTEDTRAEADFEVRVPSGVLFVGKNVNGNVTARGLVADAEASTVNGNVSVTTQGWAEASTVNGSIKVTAGRADWQGSAHFSTVNGSIELTLPEGFNAVVEASTVNGDFYSDFPLTVQGKFGPRRITGTIGDGGRKLELETVNGSIRINKS